MCSEVDCVLIYLSKYDVIRLRNRNLINDSICEFVDSNIIKVDLSTYSSIAKYLEENNISHKVG